MARRIIPAYAGYTVTMALVAGITGNHPRIRGVHRVDRTRHQLSRGSSPHTRGTPGRQGGLRHCSRIIPAYAGYTLLSARPGCIWVHPRIRGVHIVFLPFFCRLPGSSPHARGPHDGCKALAPLAGFIPACAGSTDNNDVFRQVVYHTPQNP